MSDSYHSLWQPLAGALAVLGSIQLVHLLVTGRWLFARANDAHVEDRARYWAEVFRLACMVATVGLVATIVPERLFVPVICLATFAPALLAALVTGRFDWEADDKRIATPAAFWGWVAFYVLLVALFAALMVMELT